MTMLVWRVNKRYKRDILQGALLQRNGGYIVGNIFIKSGNPTGRRCLKKTVSSN